LLVIFMAENDNRAALPTDANHKVLMGGVSSADGYTPLPVEIDPLTGRVLVSLPPGGGGLTDAELRASPVDVTFATTVYKKLIDDTTTPNVTYVGEAVLGTALSAASWRIKKIDETSGIVITWTGTGFDAVWDDRVTEAYS
jgi:hypothetical protein